MPIFDAALAFALTMLLVASTVTIIVRGLQTLLKTRSKLMGKMLTDYFDEELKPVIDREMNRLSKQVHQSVGSTLSAAADKLTKEDVFKGVDFSKLVEVSTEELTEMVKRSSLGEDLLKTLGDDAQATFAELGRRYEEIGKKFTESFRRNSRFWSTIVAFVLALGVNIDSIHVLDTYIRNEGLRDGVVAQMDAVLGRYETGVASVDEDAAEANEVTKEQLQQAVDGTRAQIDFLMSAGLPIGWTYFPHACLSAATSDCEQGKGVGSSVMWVFGIALTAVLAGLGAPFWYDSVTGISRVAQRTRAPQKPVQ